MPSRQPRRTAANEYWKQTLAAAGTDTTYADVRTKTMYEMALAGSDRVDAATGAAKRATAKEAAPDEPQISDTLGWILYNRGVYQRALALLKESAAKLPESPEVQYHLGMASLKAGDKDTAKKSLAAAAASPTNFTGKDEAKRTLAQLR